MSPQKLRDMLRNPGFRKRNPHLVNPPPGSPVRVPQHERHPGHEPLGQAQGTPESAGRFRIRITVHRNRLIDPDNAQFPKYWVDCLRYAGAIPQDTAAVVEEVVCKQALTHGQERTVIELEKLP